MKQELIEKLKREHPGKKLRGSRIRMPRETGMGTITIVWREPNYEDYDFATSTGLRANEDPQAGNNALADALIVHPDKDSQVFEKLKETPAALNKWITETIMPFFGTGATIKSFEL